MRLRGENELRAAFRAMGAVSAGTARPGKDLVVDKASFDNLLSRGVIREGAPGTFYLHEPRQAPRQLGVKLLFWVVVLLLPVGIMQFCAGP